jgi:thioredoxin 2
MSTTELTDHPATVLTCPDCGTRNRIRPIERGTPACARCHRRLPWVVDADDTTFDAQAACSVTVVVDLWAAWCGPCRAVAPVLAQLADRHAGKVKVVKVDVDRSPLLAADFGAQSIPLLVVLRDGSEVDRVVGAMGLAALEARLAPHL